MRLISLCFQVQSELHESLWDMQRTQEHLISQIDLLTQKILHMQQFLLNQSQDMQKMQEHLLQVAVAHRTQDAFVSKRSSKHSSKTTPDDDDSVEL